MSFQKATRYRLKDPEHFDDEDHGSGYEHVETYGDCDGMFITDCWVVNSQGSVHPGYAESPVPVRFEDVAEAVGPASNGDRQRSSAQWA